MDRSHEKKKHERHSQFKKGIRSEDKTRQREDKQLSIRKEKRDEKMDVKRRQMQEDNAQNNVPIVPPTLQMMSREDERKNRQSQRIGEFKKGITSNDAFSRRFQQQNLRIKENREQILDKKREKVVESRSSTNLKDINEWKKMLFLSSDNEENVQKVYQAIYHFRSLTSSGKDVGNEIQAIIELGIGPRIVELANASKFPKIQYEATWLLTNLTSGNSEQTRYVSYLPNVINVLLNILHVSHDERVRENVVWTLANIAGDNIGFRDNVLMLPNVIPLLLNNLTKSKTIANSKTTIWCLSNLFRGKPFPKIPENTVESVIHVFATMLNGIDLHSSTNEEIVSDMCWTISYISDQTKEMEKGLVPKYGDLLITSGLVEKMIALLYSKKLNIKQPALRIVGNLVAGTTEQTSFVLKNGFLIKAVTLLDITRKSENIRKETVWTLSNIAAGTEQQKKDLMNSGLVEKVIRLLESDTHSIKNECLWVLSNLTDSYPSPNFIEQIVDLGVLTAVCDSLSSNDNNFLMRALILLDKILKFSKDNGRDYNKFAEDADCIDKLESLQEHANIEIYEMAVYLVETYFNDEGEDDIYSPTMSDRGDATYSPSMPEWNPNWNMSTEEYNF